MSDTYKFDLSCFMNTDSVCMFSFAGELVPAVSSDGSVQHAG